MCLFVPFVPFIVCVCLLAMVVVWEVEVVVGASEEVVRGGPLGWHAPNLLRGGLEDFKVSVQMLIQFQNRCHITTPEQGKPADILIRNTSPCSGTGIDVEEKKKKKCFLQIGD